VGSVHRALAHPVGIWPSPLGTFGPKPKTGDSPSLRGGLPEIHTDWVETGSPRWPTDGEEYGGGEAVVDNVDERWPEWDFGSVCSRG
jgi:hypothetical protein